MSTIRTMKPLHWFVPVTRQERRSDGLLVEGYAYVNAVVGDGINLKRSAMEEASTDYMRWGALREMHGPSAAGTATAEGCGITWDEHGAFLRALVVDAEAIKKCESGTYKGFSVGVRPQVMRGNDVEKCIWIENSLVDRPADPDAILALARAASADLSAERDVVVLEADEQIPVRRDFASAMAADELWEDGVDALYTLWDVLVGIAVEDGEDKEAAARASISQFADYIAPMVAGGSMPERAVRPDVTRVNSLVSEQAALITRAEAAESLVSETRAELAIVRASLSTREAELVTAKEQVERLSKEPVPVNAPVRFPEALNRTFAAGRGAGAEEAVITALRTEYAKLQEDLKPENTPDQAKRQAGVTRMQVVKMQLNSLGAQP